MPAHVDHLDDRPSDSPDMVVAPITGETRWETYTEAGVRLGITPEAVRAHAKRQRWPRHRLNSDPNGPVMVAIPPNFRPGRTPAKPHADPGQSAASEALRLVLAQAEARVVTAENARLATEARVDRAELRADRAEARADRAEQRADNAEGRATAATGRAEQAEASANQARAEVQEATVRAEQIEAERDMARADHQKAVETVQRLEAAEARLSKAVEAHGSEVAGLRVRADEAVARAERAEGERDQARTDHQKAMQANRKWEAADAARKARGRVRRVWDGWRGR